jgi:K+-transporting ATPase ATPase C chain
MKPILISFRMLAALTLLLGLVYPLAMTGVAQVLFPWQAKGSLIQAETGPVGSEWVGQSFASDRYYWPRPSAVDYSPQPSSGTNLGPTSAALAAKVAERKLRLAGDANAESVPPDLLFASGSGLDPHISPAAARYQIARVLRSRGLPETKRPELEALVQAHTQGPQWGLFGEPRVHVLRLNLALDSLSP